MSSNFSSTWASVRTSHPSSHNLILTNSNLIVSFCCTVILSTVVQACDVERINKDHGMVHSKARAAMASRTTTDALYIFTNESLLHKKAQLPPVHGTFESFIAAVAAPGPETENVLSTLSNLDVGEFLPAETSPSRHGAGDDTDGTSSGDDGASSSDDDEEDDDYVYVKNAEVPDGFESVVMPDPLAYIPNDAIQNHYLMLCCDDLEWMLGKIIKMNKPSARLQLNVEWKQGDTAGQQAKLSNYFVVGGDASPTPGSWFYVKMSRFSEASPSRRRARGEEEEESKGGDGSEEEGGGGGGDGDADMAI